MNFLTFLRKTMASIEVKNFTNGADEVSTPSNARVETVNVGGQRVIKLTVQPGWKWSKDIKPIVGTESCQAKHIGVIVEGTVTCRHNDGTEVTYSGGDAYAVEPGHDAWVVGDKPAVAYEFHGAWGE
jgi:hypothetical protein